MANLLDSLVGGSKQNQNSVSGIAALPPEVQQAYIKTLLPAALKQFEKPFRPAPMQRVNAPSTPFDSQAMYQLQQYSDAMGGMFTPTNQTPAQSPYATGNQYGLQPTAPAAPNGGQGTFDTSGLAALAQKIQSMIMDNPGTDLKTNAPGVGQARTGFMDDPMAWLKGNNITGGSSTASKLVQAMLGLA